MPRIKRLTAWFLGLVTLSLATSCSTLQPLARTERNFYDSILIHGRFSANFDQNSRPQSLQGRFEWRQNGHVIDIDLLSPLGQTAARISIVPGLAKIQLSGKETKVAGNITELTEQTLGWALPVSGMRDWLQGFSRSQTSQLQTASPNGTAIFDTDGWRIQYVSWQENEVSVYPKRIDLVRTALNATPLSLRIVIDHWEPR
jgi:outer membrane lipoprotein LolB